MTRRALRDYVTLYLDEVGSLRYRDISSVQPAPYASLARGAGGIVYVLWRRGERRAARRWLKALAADRRRPAYKYGEMDFPRSSFMYGRAGVHWLAALLDTDRAVSAYARESSSVVDTSFMAGAAGYLTGARILLERKPDRGLHRRTAALANTMLAQLQARPWHRLEASGFAVRLPGLLHALLAWSEFVGEPVPPWLVTSMHTLAEAWSLDAVPTGFTATWCNGAVGMTLLWTKAFACTNDEQFLDAARRMARLATSVDEQRSILCCGLAGVAYSLLELSRHDPTNNDWREQAFDIGVRAVQIAQREPLEWPNGLYIGHPGIVCLAADLLVDQPQGFPAIYERGITAGT